MRRSIANELISKQIYSLQQIPKQENSSPTDRLNNPNDFHEISPKWIDDEWNNEGHESLLHEHVQHHWTAEFVN